MPPPARPRPAATALYVTAGVAAGIAAGLVHYALPAALQFARAGLLAKRGGPTADDPACSAAGAGQGGEAVTSLPLSSHLVHWLSLTKVGGTAAAMLSLAGAKSVRSASGPRASASGPPPPVVAVQPPPSRLGRIAVGLPSSSPASVIIAPGAGRYYWKPASVSSDPATPRSGPATPLRVPASTDSELVAVLRAKLAGEEPPVTPSSARSEGEMVPANYTGARPPLYVSPRANASADGGGVFGRSPSPSRVE